MHRPVETTRLTVEPLTLIGARRGFWLMTLPEATVLLDWRDAPMVSLHR